MCKTICILLNFNNVTYVFNINLQHMEAKDVHAEVKNLQDIKWTASSAIL